MSAHRYWALLVTARPGTGNGVAIAEVLMRGTSGGANLATGGTAGGTNTVGHPPAQAFDGNAATEWRDGGTGGLPVRLFYDFGAAVDIAEIVVTVPNAASPYRGGIYGPAACWVQWSDDGSNWRYGAPGSDLSSLGDSGSATIASVSDTAPGARLAAQTVRLAPGVPALAGHARHLGVLVRHDAVDGGRFRIAGTVAIDGTPPTPVRRRVRLFHRLSGRLVRETWSATDGTFSFERIAQAEYIVMSDDYTRAYNAVNADAITAVP